MVAFCWIFLTADPKVLDALNVVVGDCMKVVAWVLCISTCLPAVMLDFMPVLLVCGL